MSGNIKGLQITSDFAEAVAKALGWKLAQVNETFDFEEDKMGFFLATLKPKKFLETPDFRTMCALTRDLGGEYVKGQRMFVIPGPSAKKASVPEISKLVTTSTPTPIPTSSDARSIPEPASGVAPDSLTYDRSGPPNIPNLKFIPVDAIHIPPFLPTRELISHERLSEIRESIKKHGLKYPIKVRRFNSSDYELIDGYLRLKSVQQLGWKGILAEIKDASDQEVIVESIVTNKYRAEEDPITIAKKCDVLINAYGWTQEKLAEETGLSREYVANATRLLKLPKQIQREIASNKIGFRHALTLLTVNNVDLQLQLAKEVVEEGSTISELEHRIEELQPKPVAPSPLEPSAPSQPSETSTEARRAVQPGRETEMAPAALAVPEEVEEPKVPEPEKIDTGFQWECPECHRKLQLIHIKYPDGRIKHAFEGDE